MKKSIIVYLFLLVTVTRLCSQIHFDILAGYSPATSPVNTGIIVNRSNPVDEFQFNMVRVHQQFYTGIRAYTELNAPFFLEGGITYTERTCMYHINHTYARESRADEFIDESEKIIQVPVNIGVSIGALNITSGLSLRKSLSSAKEMNAIQGFHADKNNFCMAFQFGARYAFNKVMAGVEFQGALQRVCHGMYVNKQSLEVRNVPSQFVFTIQYRI